MYSTLLSNRISTWTIKHKTIINNQFGFQKGNSTADCIFIVQSLISKTRAEKKKTNSTLPF